MHILSISTISNHSSIFGRIFTIFGQIKSNMEDRGNLFLVGALIQALKFAIIFTHIYIILYYIILLNNTAI